MKRMESTMKTNGIKGVVDMAETDILKESVAPKNLGLPLRKDPDILKNTGKVWEVTFEEILRDGK